ncbi:hypothetical protein [Arenibacter echinorum]|uniref:Secreted protein n=1 Tax=Arenibacter echinorum TaxID=440515 RepID=A0A327RA19_9FLAO|nr:hypothetical protein [Arenibacter echinorum]RAJ12333.1 hypothetical protein LV92_01566 [Arenibacter echinorum]
MKSKILFILSIFSLLLIGNSCASDNEACQEEPEVCACFNNPLRCVSPVGTNEVQLDSLNAVSKLPVRKKQN